jgi:hypothetical protein
VEAVNWWRKFLVNCSKVDRYRDIYHINREHQLARFYDPEKDDQ